MISKTAMEMLIENAIETVDSARQHKCELEGRRNQLKADMYQVESSSACAKHDVEAYFSAMQQKLIAAIQARRKLLLDVISDIEQNALDPLKDCQVLVEDGIEEATAVVNSGENLLNIDLESESGLSKVKKFIASTSNLSLDSVPEVPLAIEVPSISVSFTNELVSSLIEAIQLDGQVCRQSPVQITNLEAIPGGIVVSWSDIDEKDDQESFLYKLQYFHGKINTNDCKVKYSIEKNGFKDEYIGPDLSYVVRNLVSNTIYTFRVSRCLYSEDEALGKQWSPWSVHQEKMTVMPGLTWAAPKDDGAYTLTERNKAASKKNAFGTALYSEVSLFLVGYPISLKVELEGKTRNKNDCFALCTKHDSEATVIHTKDGTLCIMNDGHVWVNGTCSQTKFAKITRGTVITFHLTNCEDKPQEAKKCKVTVYRAAVTIGEHEAVFDWIPSKTGTFNPQNLALAVFLQASGWKVSII